MCDDGYCLYRDGARGNNDGGAGENVGDDDGGDGAAERGGGLEDKRDGRKLEIDKNVGMGEEQNQKDGVREHIRIKEREVLCNGEAVILSLAMLQQDAFYLEGFLQN